jgi:transcriptional regulator with XRE-family HTH domain
MTEKTNFDRYLERKLDDPEFRARFEDASRAWDVALQLAALRKARGLTQRQVADMLGTRQQAIARLEDPLYVNQSLAMVRRYAEALGALVDVVVVPNEQAAEYQAACCPKPLLGA